MAIAKMCKLNLALMAYEKDKVLDALQRTHATEIKETKDYEETFVPIEDSSEYEEYLSNIESTLSSLTAALETIRTKEDDFGEDLKNGFGVSYSMFISSGERKREYDALIEEIGQLLSLRAANVSELSKTEKAYRQNKVFYSTEEKFSSFKDTLHTSIRFGSFSTLALDEFKKTIEEEDLCYLETLSQAVEDRVTAVAVCHVSEKDNFFARLSEYGFYPCPCTDDKTGKEWEEEFISRIKALNSERAEIDKKLLSYADRIKDIKTYCDYLSYNIEKVQLSQKMRSTLSTVLLEAYVPVDEKENVEKALEESGCATYYDFFDVEDDDDVPTLLKNNKVVSSFEGVTNMYSPPNYREIDPNPIMAIFYSLFLGIIIGDMGYGLLIALAGFFIRLRSEDKKSGLCSMATTFAIGGLCAVVMGVLFNSFFGFAVFPFNLMPSMYPVVENWKLMGIAIPSVLIIMLLVGIVQLAAGYVMRGALYIYRGEKAAAVLDAFSWVVFSAGLFIIILGLVEEFSLSSLTMTGVIILVVGLVGGIIGSTLKAKGFGKVTKAFGSLYGLINYLSDILSYARLYGLLLSGAVIAQLVASFSADFMAMGAGGAIAAVFLMIVGHGLNIVICLLGAYIHDGRLQYVEFFGKFYEGEGRLFAPIGSQHKYIKIR